jgi:hypothetical protein
VSSQSSPAAFRPDRTIRRATQSNSPACGCLPADRRLPTRIEGPPYPFRGAHAKFMSGAPVVAKAGGRVAPGDASLPSSRTSHGFPCHRSRSVCFIVNLARFAERTGLAGFSPEAAVADAGGPSESSLRGLGLDLLQGALGADLGLSFHRMPRPNSCELPARAQPSRNRHERQVAPAPQAWPEWMQAAA